MNFDIFQDMECIAETVSRILIMDA